MKRPVLLLLSLLHVFLLTAQNNESWKRKLSPELQLAIQQSVDSMDLICSITDINFTHQEKIKSRLIASHPSSKTIVVRVATKHLKSFIENNAIAFADILRLPKEELTTGAFDLTLNKVNLAHNAYNHINGTGVQVSVKEQLLDSTDIDWKGRYFNSGVGAATQTSHAAIMATILGGAGNSSPYALGAAPGVQLTSSSFFSLLPDPDSVYRKYKISIQNHSYGTAVENFYGPDARAHDISVNSFPYLVHVFSAGNSGTTASSAGLYAGITGFANITGSFKMAKNIISVGSVDSFNTIMPLSSRGPAYDGRVKPELVAYGEDGSSGAAALVSGTVALLQQSYKLAHHDSLPSASLVKAVLFNSADDAGVKGIDYASGYGSLNSFEAIKTLNENHFFESHVVQGETKTFSIKIPPGIKQLKLTVNWSDTAATANAARALVNNIDALLKLPATGESWQPWTLSSYPHKDSLLLPAARKRDTLNNTEQITIDDPQPGNYMLEVTGSTIITASQNFDIAYQLDSINQFVWAYPTSSDVLKAATVNTIRWQTNMAATGKIEYSNDGINWRFITDIANTGQQYLKWQAPDTISRALLRLVIPSLGRVALSDTFTISPMPDLGIGFNCPDSFLLNWNRLPVDRYEIYQLGEKYLEPIGQTPDTLQVLQKNTHPSVYYAVSPKIGNKNGLRSYTLNYTTQGVNCYVRTFFTYLQNTNQALLSLQLGSLYQVSEISFQQLTGTGYQTIGTIKNPGSLTQVFIDSLLVQGANFYRAKVTLSNGQIVYTPVDNVYYLPGNPVLVFPNPARQNQPLKMLTLEPGKYTIQVFDMSGHLMKSFLLENMFQPIFSLQLPAGMYLVKIISDDHTTYHQKLVIY